MQSSPNPSKKTTQIKTPKDIPKDELFMDKYNGMSIKAIAEKYNVNQGTLQSHMAPGDNWRVMYDEWAANMDAERLEMAKRTLKGNVDAAAQILTSLLNSKDERIRFSAAKEMLDRNLGKADQKIELEGSGESGALLIQMVRARREDSD